MSVEVKEKRNNRGLKKLDIIIICALLLVSLISILVLFLARKEGGYVKVELDGEVVAVLPLDEDTRYEINGGSNVLAIQNGEVWMEYADCPDKTCVHSGTVRYGGESIICLPNKVAVIVVSEKEEVDLVS